MRPRDNLRPALLELANERLKRRFFGVQPGAVSGFV
jgi:hypothetical protein